jgi:hypothetical protein
VTARAAAIVILLFSIVLTISFTSTGSLLRLTTGISGAFTLWQTTPPVFGEETYWGGIGIDILYRSLSLSAAMTLADLKSFKLSDDPHFGYTASVALLKLRSISLFLAAGTAAYPFWKPYTIAAGCGLSWSPFKYASCSAEIGYQYIIRGREGRCVYVSFGLSAHIPLL